MWESNVTENPVISCLIAALPSETRLDRSQLKMDLQSDNQQMRKQMHSQTLADKCTNVNNHLGFLWTFGYVETTETEIEIHRNLLIVCYVFQYASVAGPDRTA